MSVARHPITGAPIRILRTETQISSDQKTMVYLDHHAEKSMRWSRFQTLIADKRALQVLEPVIPNYIILYNKLSDDDVAFWKRWLPLHKKEISVLFISIMVSMQLGVNFLAGYNMICYSEFNELYPFIDVRIIDSSPILDIVLAIGSIFRFKRLYLNNDLSKVKQSVSVFTKHEGEIINSPLVASLVPKFILIQQFFQHPLARRNRELKECIKRNIQNPYIDEVHLLNEKSYPEWLTSPKVKELVITNRISYDAVFRHIKNNIPPNCIVAFANTDIYLDATIRHIYSINMKGKFLSLLRWDDPNPPQLTDEKDKQPSKIFGPRPDSQDAWIILSDDVQFNPDTDDFKINFGVPGCDNALNVAMLKNKFLICNPAYTIKTHHIHNSAIRDYNPQNVVEKPIFLYIDPTAIQEYKSITNLDSFIWQKGAPSKMTNCARRIKYVNENAAATVCTMLRRDKIWDFNVNEENEFVYEEAAKPKIYQFKNKFMSAEGLVYGMHEIYLGKNPIWKEGWEKSNANILAKAMYTKNLIVAPMNSKIGNNLALWFLFYVTKVRIIHDQIRMLNQNLNTEFLICQIEGISDFVSMLDWQLPGNNLNLIHYDEKVQYYAENLFVIEPDAQPPTPIEIEYLRKLIPSVLQEVTNEKGVVILCVEDDGEILSKAWLQRIQETAFKDWTVRYVTAKTTHKELFQLMCTADVLVGQSNSKWMPLSWMWCLKATATVIEVIKDTEPKGENVHLAGVCKLQYAMIVAKREPIDYQREHACRDITLAVKNFCYTKALTTAVQLSDRPVVVVPFEPQEMHAHSGDTFREMVELWSAKGLVQIQRSSTTPYCWLGKIGGILLYDRPTLKWLDPTLKYEFGLFGNCTPPITESPEKNSVWSFWPRSPRKLEEFIDSFIIQTYEQRTTETIFLGKVENGIQMKNRTKCDWSQAIQKWSMPLDSTGKPYAYTQDEYLLELSNSRYGLALAGYGNKCNREIEYFALGVVPLCAPEVDMKYYLNPPTEGIHYLRIKGPEEIKDLIASISAEKWEEMSKAGQDWWKANASTEGMFRLTLETCRKIL